MRISDWSSDVCSSDLLDADGLVVADTLHPVPEPRDLSARGYFRAHRDGAVDLHIQGAPETAVQRQHFILSRAVRDANGTFRGVLAAAIYSDYFADLYREIDALPGIRSSLRLLDGRSEERRVGQESVSPGRSRWWPIN